MLRCTRPAVTTTAGLLGRRRHPPRPPPQYLDGDGVAGHAHAEAGEGRQDDGDHGLQMELQCNIYAKTRRARAGRSAYEHVQLREELAACVRVWCLRICRRDG
jgi:hypothetical protein